MGQEANTIPKCCCPHNAAGLAGRPAAAAFSLQGGACYVSACTAPCTPGSPGCSTQGSPRSPCHPPYFPTPSPTPPPTHNHTLTHPPTPHHPPLPGARETVRFLPPLNVKPGEIREALTIFEQAMAEVFGRGDVGGGSSGFGQDLGGRGKAEEEVTLF